MRSRRNAFMELTRREALLWAGAAALSATPALARAAGSPRALVTADLESAIVVVEPRSGRALGRIACRPDPRSIERVGVARALVAHTAGGEVSLVDGRRRRVDLVLSGLGEPRYAAVRSDSALAYVTDSAGGRVLTIDLERGRVVHRVAVGGPARHLGLSKDGRRLWTALGNRAAEIAVLDLADPRRPRLVRRLRPPFLAHDVAAAPDGGFWVSSGDQRRMAVFAAGRTAPARLLEADAPPQHIAFAGGVAYVASGDDGTLRAHRLSDGRRMWTATVPVGSYNVTTGSGLVVTPSLSMGTLSSVAPGRRSASRTQVARSAHDACVI